MFSSFWSLLPQARHRLLTGLKDPQPRAPAFLKLAQELAGEANLEWLSRATLCLLLTDFLAWTKHHPWQTLAPYRFYRDQNRCLNWFNASLAILRAPTSPSQRFRKLHSRIHAFSLTAGYDWSIHALKYQTRVHVHLLLGLRSCGIDLCYLY